ncbi:MAG: hypothetical protein LC119_05730 [Burkholderiales bacterium]|nr:hypothetical protein [Burkholderiales bacterium]
MATIHGAVKGVQILNDSLALALRGAEKTALITVDFGAYTGSTDSADIEGLSGKIAARMRNGKTVTLRQAHCCAPGADTNKQLVFTGAITVASADLQFNLCALDRSTELTSATASEGVAILVTFTES